MTATVLVDRDARSFLREADPVLTRVIDAQPDFRPRARLGMLPRLSYFGTLIFQMVSVAERWRPYRSLAVSYLFASD